MLPSETFTLTPTETPTEPPTETPTESPSETPTETPTPAAEVTTEAEVTAEVTEAVVEILAETPTWTETYTATPSLTPTNAPLPEPPLALLSSDNFNTLTSSNWLIPPDWMPFQTDKGGSLLAPNSLSKLLSVRSDLFNVVVEASFMIHGGKAEVSTRHNSFGGYRASLDRNGQVNLYRGEVLLQSGLITPFMAGWWHTLRLSSIENTLRVSVDGVEVVVVQDSAPLPPGAVVMSGDSANISTLFIDDLSVWIPASEGSGLLLAIAQAESAAPASYSVGGELASQLMLQGGSTSVVFARWVGTAGNRDIFMVDPDNLAAGEINITNSEFFDEYSPDLSPDGTKLAFVIDSSIYVIDANIGNMATLWVTNAGLPNWAPNSQRLAFVADWDGDGEIYYVDTANGSPTKLTNNDYYDTAPTWSPDGDEVAYSAFVPDPLGTRFEIFKVTLGGVVTELTHNTITESDPDWSPVGTIDQIAFVRYVAGSADIYKMNATDGSGVTGVATTPLLYEDIPVWSPDGLRFVFSIFNISTGQRDLYLMNNDGSNKTGPIVVNGYDNTWSNAFSTIDPNELAYYNAFKGIMFWAIYNESNANQTADRPDITAPFYPLLGDHRYLMARAMLSNIPLNDYASGVAYMKRWKGSIGNTLYDLWRLQGKNPNDQNDSETSSNPDERICRDNNNAQIGFYKDQTSDTAILNWFTEYVNCFRTNAGPYGGKLSALMPSFDVHYNGIMQQVEQAIQDHILGSANPVAGAGFIKTTSACYVPQRNEQGLPQGCYGARNPINMTDFCLQVPNRPGDPTVYPNRDCQMSSQNPAGINITVWLNSQAAKSTNQQLDFNTVINQTQQISLGLYTPDLPSLGCPNRCFFLAQITTQFVGNETVTAAWERHRQKFLTYVPGSSVVGYAHVLRTEPNNQQTWITFVFQSEE